MEKPNKKISIGWKLLIYLSLFSAGLLVMLWLLQIVFMADFYRFVRMKEAMEIASQVERRLESGTVNQLAEYMNSQSAANDVSIAVAASDGTLTAFSTGSMGMEMFQNIATMRQYLLQSKGGTTSHFYTNETIAPDGTVQIQEKPGKSDAVVHIRTTSDGQYIIVLSALRPINATINTIKSQFVYIAGFMIGLSALMAFILSRKISDPLKQLNADARKFAEGRYDVEFKGGGFKEVAELSDTLNYASQELGKVESYRRELLANVSHDLRTPLTLIEGYAEAMRDIPGENNPDNAQIIIDESIRLTSLVNDILDVSRISRGIAELNKTQFDFNALCQTETDRIRALVKKDGYDIVFESPGAAIVFGDEVRLRQVIYNLLINAVNYSEDNKAILVKLSQTDGKVRFSVTDHGPGIPPEELNLIWERYYKSKASHRRAVTGSGMGLAIVRTIVDAQGGNYGVNSQLNEGSTFWIELDRQ